MPSSLWAIAFASPPGQLRYHHIASEAAGETPSEPIIVKETLETQILGMTRRNPTRRPVSFLPLLQRKFRFLRVIRLSTRSYVPIVALAALFAGWPLVPVMGQPAEQPAALPHTQNSADDPRSVLYDSQADDDALLNAARQIVAQASRDSRHEVTLIGLLLKSPSPQAHRVLLTELARSGAHGAKVYEALGQLLDTDDLETASLALGALARAHTPDAVAIVVRLLNDDSGAPPTLRLAAVATLKRQTGIVKFGGDAEAWQAWWQTAQFLSQAEWHRQLASAQGERADALEHELLMRTVEVVELHRELHLLTAEDDRQAFLSQLIASPTPELRELGLELTQRRLLNARPIGNPIVHALATLLADTEPQVRVDTANLLARLGRPETMQHVLAALLRETDDSSAVALFAAASRHPQPALLLPALQWLEEGSKARFAAIDMLQTLINSGVTLDTAQESRIRMVLLQMAANGLPRSAIALLIELRETQTVLGLLLSSDPQQVRWAADVLAETGVAIDALVRAARDDRSIVIYALVALEQHQPTVDRLTQALDLADLDDSAHTIALANLARAIEPRALLTLSRDRSDLKSREAILAPAGNASFFEVRTDCTARAELAIALAQTRLDLGAPSEALAGLGHLPLQWRGPRVQVLEIDSLLRLDRIDDAVASTISAASRLGLADPFVQPWLAKIKASDELVAASLAIKLRLTLGDLLTERDHARIDVLAGPTDDDAALVQEHAGDDDNTSPK